MNRFKFATLAFAGLIALAPIARAEVIDFTTATYGTSVSSGPGVVFSLQGGLDSSGAPAIGAFSGTVYGLSNTVSGWYPTAEMLDMTFAAPVNDVSFTFNNWGSGNGSTFTAYDGTTIVDSADISSVTGLDGYGLVTVTGADITKLVLDNGSGGNYDWEFAVGELTYSPSAVPEPSSLLLMGSGVLGMAGMLRRKLLAR